MFNKLQTQLKHLSYLRLSTSFPYVKEIKATRYRRNKELDNGYSVSNTSGGLSQEGFTRITKGTRNWYYPNYNRKGKTRVNKYILDVNNNSFANQ
tara:strand:+ start:178 stop:462 length:285 start_codon:yes stop_codon:yes gene_type:complete